ncbi:MAG TPA: phenylalanine 4-monooxygenase [Gammaproteobacteria bacterium]|nr:phenylalanine 4-monooxygenase [Gammaproteobacteria bacterium]
MGQCATYTSRIPDARGYIRYTDEENRMWHDLITTQLPCLHGRACNDYIRALDRMAFPQDRIPQLSEVSAVLMDHTGWSVTPVPALIDFATIFELLASRRFPAATFIRNRDEMNYLREPDIFHEIFGHTPLLTDQRFANFCEAYGKAGMAAAPADHAMLARLFWFTVEFGLIRTPWGLRTYGAGIVSSPGELIYALESDAPQRRRLDVVEALRTPYRIDIFQSIYFTIDSFDELYALAEQDLPDYISEARRKGMLAPVYPCRESA